MSAATAFIPFLLDRFQIEWKRRDRSGVYGFTQRLMAYNSNKIEGSTLTEEQTASLFDTGTLPKSDDYYRAKDVEEMNGHFLMFNKMLETLDQPLSQDLIKQFHYELKSGVFEDRANGYAMDNGEIEQGLICIGAPVYDLNCRVVAAVSVSGPDYRMTADQDEMIQEVKCTAANISRVLGYRG